MDVMAVTAGASTFVASKRPPRPTSTTAVSTPARRKISKAMAVVTSKKVGHEARAPVRAQSIDDREHVGSGVVETAGIDRLPVYGDSLLDVLRCGEV